MSAATTPMREKVPPDVLAVCKKLRAAGHEAHLVGGGVRDMLLGRVPADFDVATDAVPEAVVELFGKTFAIPTGLKHGTVTVLSETRRPVEVTTTTKITHASKSTPCAVATTPRISTLAAPRTRV